MTSFETMKKYVGKVVLISDGPVKYESKIVDVRCSYGSLQYLVEPVAGIGQKWVMSYLEKK